MTTNTNLFIAVILLILITIYNIYVSKKYKKVIKQQLYNRIKKLKTILYTISILTLFILLIVQLVPLGTNPTNKEVLKAIINSISIAILILPLSLETLYLTMFHDEEKYTHIKTIVTNINDKKIFQKFNDAKINIILLSEKKSSLKQICADEINTKTLNENIQIKTDNLKILDNKINKETTIKEFKSLEKIYDKIHDSRAVHDNYIKAIKYLITTYLSIVLSYFFLVILNFPITYNIELILLLKIYTTLVTRILYKSLPKEQDLMNRTVKPSNIIFGKQELFLTIIEAFIIFFCISSPYMYVLSKGVGTLFANTILYVTIIITNILLTYYYVSDSSFIVNIIKTIKNYKFHIFTLISILFIIFINNNNYFLTRNITLQNNIGCLIISIVCMLMLETIKLARFISMKGKTKNEFKNNKKSRRSKSNNS